MGKKIGRLFGRAKRAWGVLTEHKFTTIAGTLVFFLVMSVAPFLFWLSLLFGTHAADEFYEIGLFGWAGDLFRYLQESAREASAGAGVLFLATTLWSSTGFFYHLRRSGEILYDYRRSKKGWKVRLSAVAFTFGLLVFFALAGGLAVAVTLILRDVFFPIRYLCVYALLLVFGFFAAWLLNVYVCPYRVSPSDTAAGSAVTAGAWFLASVLFTFYLRFSSPERLYGALSLVVVFLLWLYWMMVCFTAGVIYNRRRINLRPKEHKTL